MDFILRLFDTSGFPARWRCGAGWSETPWLGWLHILSDLGVWTAYVAIPLVLLFFLRRRGDLPFQKIFLLFGAFILACGITHLMEALIFWWPAYRLAAILKLFTAIVSWVTVFALVRVVPRALAMRTPEELEREVSARKRAEEALQVVNADLERRIGLRTADLSQAVAALADERELLRTTLASIGDGVIVTDPAGNVTFLNAVAEQLTGWSTANAIGQPLEKVFRIVNEQTRLPVENPAQRALAEGVALGVALGLANHTVLLALDGSERSIDDSAAPIRGEDGAVRGAVLVFRDISERQQAEETLRQTELRERARAAELETVLRATPTPIWISHDKQCRQVTGNPASYRLLQTEEETNISASPAEPLKRKFQEFRDGKPVPSHELPLQITASRGITIQGAEISLVFDDGQVRHIYGNTAPIRDRDGEVRGAVGAFVDITELKNFEDSLKEADRRKDEFLATLAHELRNPLAPIKNSLEVMKRANNDPELLEQSRATMERQLEQMVRLIDDLLDVSRISRNRLELRRERVELASVIHHVVEACRPMVEAMNLELKVMAPMEPIYLNGDSVRLAQVFGNLLTNACKYTEPGGRVVLSIERQEGEVVVVVKDSGVGIPREMLPKVFEMFTQIDRSLDRSQGGVGIGLSLVKRLVEMHEGSVTAHSEGLGQGSDFEVRLPILGDHQVLEARALPNETLTTSGRRFLVVDDNRDSALTLAILMKLSGNEVQTAHDGLEAVEIAEMFKPEIILLDLGLPKLNGYEVCRRIRAQPWGANIVIIALSGWGQAEDLRKSKEAGFNGHLVKPVDHAALMKLLDESQSA